MSDNFSFVIDLEKAQSAAAKKTSKGSSKKAAPAPSKKTATKKTATAPGATKASTVKPPKSTKPAPASAKKAKASTKSDQLPEGGVWRTVRGSHVYIVDGNVVAGAEGRLNDFDQRELTAIHQARENNKDVGQIIYEGTEVKVGRERKIGIVKKETGTHYHIDYDGETRKVPKSQVRRADAYRLKMEGNLERAGAPGSRTIKLDGGGIDLMIGESEKAKEKIKKHEQDRKNTGATTKKTEQAIRDLLPEDAILRDTPVASMKAPMLKRDEWGIPIRIPTGETDPVTGQPILKYDVYEKPDATEDEVIRDHQGLIIDEIVNPYAKRYGLEYIQREWRDEYGRPVDLYGDLVQTANIGFLHGIREYAHKAAAGTAPQVTLLTHGLQRSRDYVRRQAQDIFNAISLPEKLLSPLSAVAAVEESMEKKLGRKPTHQEMIDGIEDVPGLKGNVVFNSLKMQAPPRYDASKAKFVTGEDIVDPVKKLEAVYAAKRLQRVSSLEGVKLNSKNSEDKELELKDTIADEEAVVDKKMLDKERSDRDKNLRNSVSKLMGGLLDEREAKLIALRFGIGIKKQKTIADLSDVAEAMGITVPLAKKISASAMNKLKNAPADTLDSLKKLYMTKSLNGIDVLVKALFVADLRDRLSRFGLGYDDLDTRFVRTAYGTLDDIQKSLNVTEFVGSAVSALGDDRYHARVIEYVLPEDLALLHDSIEKAFSKTSNPITKHKAIESYIKANSDKYTALGAEQAASFKQSGGVTWSEQLLLSNPGSCWITWHGDHILVHGQTGAVLYDSSNKMHRERFHKDVEKPHYEHLDDKDFKDQGHQAVEDEMAEVGKKWRVQSDTKRGVVSEVVGGYMRDWRDANKGKFFRAPDKGKINKMFPSGTFLMTNPYTGQRLVLKVDLKDPYTKNATTAVSYAFDPDADEKVNIGNWKAIYRKLYGEDTSANAYTELANKANAPGKHQLEVLSEDEYNSFYGNTKEGAKALMVHKNFEDVTPSTMKVFDEDSQNWKVVKYKGSRRYEADLGNGRIARVDINEDGHFVDPVMERLINPLAPINDANDLYKAMRDAVGNEAWVTISSSKLTDLNHHVKLKYDGKGAPIVVGGAFDGYRFQDASEMDSPEDKAKSLFKNGKPVRPSLKKTEKQELPLEVGSVGRIRNPQDKRKWIDVRITGTGKFGRGLEVELSPEDVAAGVSFENGQTKKVFENGDPELQAKRERLNIASEAPVIDTARGGMLNITVPEDQRGSFEANYGVALDDGGRANMSIKQFMELRDQMGGASLTHKAKDYLEEFYAKQQREGKPDVSGLLEKFNPNNIDGYKDNSFLKKTNLYSSQVEGIEHLLQAGKGIAGHGMGTGKTLLGVGGSMYLRDQALKAGKTPGKTLIVSPASIQNEWLKEINRHTNVGAVCITNNMDAHGKVGDITYSQNDKGEYITDEHGHKIVKEDLRSRAISPKDYSPDHPEHFAVMSYEQFANMPRAKLLEWAEKNHFENVMFDEVHAFKTAEGSRNNALFQVAEKFPKVWGLSGTPIDNEVTDIYNLVNAVTGGQHDLGSKDEFNNSYLLKNGGKIVGMNESKVGELGQKLAKYVQFRNGYTDRVHYVDGATGEQQTVQFPHVQAPNRHQGELAHVTDFNVQYKGDQPVNVPNLEGNERLQKVYNRYREIEAAHLTEAQRQAIETMNVEAGSKNYLQGVQKLQQYLNAPHSELAYWEPTTTGDGKATGGKTYPYSVDANGHKRYYKAMYDKDEKPIGYEKDANGKPVLLPPMHHNNPRADKLRDILLSHLNEIDKENERRTAYNKQLKPGEPKLPTIPPKVIVTSNFTTFGTDVIANVLRDIEHTRGLKYGSYTGGDESQSRAHDKVAFQQDPNTAFMVISDAGKEGIDLGNAQMVVHYDHDFNPNLMAQKSARALRSDSWKHAKRQGRENEVKVVSLSMPGTVDDNIFRGQNRKMEASEQVENAVRRSEGQATVSDYATVYAGSQKQWARRKQEAAEQPVAKLASIPLIVKLR